MEIKVFKDNSKQEKAHGGMTTAQWLLIVSLVVFLVIDIANQFQGFLPNPLVKIVGLSVVGFTGCNAVIQPYQMRFMLWLKLYLKFNTTIQTRVYKRERLKEYGQKDFQNKAREQW